MPTNEIKPLAASNMIVIMLNDLFLVLTFFHMIGFLSFFLISLIEWNTN